MRTFIQFPGNRKQWAFSQREIALLAGVHPTVISRYESGALTPGARTLIALEIVFQRSGRHLLPAIYKEIEDKVMRRAARLDRSLRGLSDAKSVRKRAHLSKMAKAAGA